VATQFNQCKKEAMNKAMNTNIEAICQGLKVIKKEVTVVLDFKAMRMKIRTILIIT